MLIMNIGKTGRQDKCFNGSPESFRKERTGRVINLVLPTGTLAIYILIYNLQPKRKCLAETFYRFKFFRILF